MMMMIIVVVIILRSENQRHLQRESKWVTEMIIFVVSAANLVESRD